LIVIVLLEVLTEEAKVISSESSSSIDTFAWSTDTTIASAAWYLSSTKETVTTNLKVSEAATAILNQSKVATQAARAQEIWEPDTLSIKVSLVHSFFQSLISVM
jgi:hypothetical protein